MKGFKEKAENNGKFFVIKHNCICQESSKEREGYEPVEVMNPETKEVIIKFIKRYDSLEAMVTNIEWRDTEDQYSQRYMSWKIHLKANGDAGVLELPFNSRVGSRFMKLAENVDFSKPVEFRAWRDNEDRTAFIVKQEEKSVPQKYTKDSPGLCPPPVQKFGGKWNFDDQMEFLYTQMMNVVIPRVRAAADMNGHQVEEVYQPGSAAPPDIDPEDIPF